MEEPRQDKKRRAGMHDVARLAGVSHQTVSRVLNDDPHVRPSTRETVRHAIDELGYRRNTLARALVTNRSFTIGVVFSGSGLWGPSRTLVGVERAAREAGYFVSAASVRYSNRQEMDTVFEHFAGQSVEGIIVIASEAVTEHAVEPFTAQVPVVMVAAGTGHSPGVHVTSVDQEGGARAITRHLIDLGHRDIAHVTGPLDWFDASSRVRGWGAELDAAGLPRARLIRGDWTAESGFAAGRELLSEQLPTAIFAANDLMALGVVKALEEADVSVPRDVSVAGFDDIPGASYFRPALTTIRQDFPALGRQCIAILLDVLAGKESERHPIAPILVQRGSTQSPGKRRLALSDA